MKEIIINTKEELEKEAYQYDKEHLCCNGARWYRNVTVKEAYLAGAEPREKRIAELKAQIEQLTYLHNEDVNTIKLLNERIREMRCCYNCKQSQDEGYCKIKKSDVNDLSCWDCGCDEWEIKEK